MMAMHPGFDKLAGLYPTPWRWKRRASVGRVQRLGYLAEVLQGSDVDILHALQRTYVVSECSKPED